MLKVVCLHFITLIEVLSSGIRTGCYPVNKNLLFSPDETQSVDYIFLTRRNYLLFVWLPLILLYRRKLCIEGAKQTSCQKLLLHDFADH